MISTTQCYSVKRSNSSVSHTFTCVSIRGRNGNKGILHFYSFITLCYVSSYSKYTIYLVLLLLLFIVEEKFSRIKHSKRKRKKKSQKTFSQNQNFKGNHTKDDSVSHSLSKPQFSTITVLILPSNERCQKTATPSIFQQPVYAAGMALQISISLNYHLLFLCKHRHFCYRC